MKNRTRTFFVPMAAALFLVAIFSMSAQGQTPEDDQKGSPAGQDPAFSKPYPMGQVEMTLPAGFHTQCPGTIKVTQVTAELG